MGRYTGKYEIRGKDGTLPLPHLDGDFTEGMRVSFILEEKTEMFLLIFEVNNGEINNYSFILLNIKGPNTNSGEFPG